MRAADVGARVTQPAQDGRHLSGALQSRGQAFVRRFGLFLNPGQQLG